MDIDCKESLSACVNAFSKMINANVCKSLQLIQRSECKIC